MPGAGSPRCWRREQTTLPPFPAAFSFQKNCSFHFLGTEPSPAVIVITIYGKAVAKGTEGVASASESIKMPLFRVPLVSQGWRT